MLEERMELRRQTGAPIEMVSSSRVAAIEPGLTSKVAAASWCAADGYANASLTGTYYRARLKQADVAIRERAAVTAIDPGFTIRANIPVRTSRVLLATGAWLKVSGRMIGLDLPVRARVNTVTVTERGPKLIGSVIGHATGLLTLKQKANGTVLIGGGWQGDGAPEAGPGQVRSATLLPNLQLAQFAVPDLGRLRVVRSWTGYEGNVPDFYPLAGAAPGIAGAFLLGCVRGGYTIGPYIGALMGELILGRTPELPLFDPARFGAMEAA